MEFFRDLEELIFLLSAKILCLTESSDEDVRC